MFLKKSDKKSKEKGKPVNEKKKRTISSKNNIKQVIIKKKSLDNQNSEKISEKVREIQIREIQKSGKIVKDEKSSLQSVIDALFVRQLEEQTLDFHMKTKGFDSEFSGAYLLDSVRSGFHTINYVNLFSYLSGNSKENPYMNYFERKRQEAEDKERKETQAKELSYDKIAKFVNSSRLKSITGVESYEETPFLKEKYEYFKIFNQAYSFLLYQMLT